MKKLFVPMLLLLLAGLTTTAAAFEKDVDYVVCEEVYADTYKAFGDTYPASPADGWPACTTGTLLTGTVITGNLDGVTCTPGNYAYHAFDGDVATIFENFEMSPRSYVGLILDQAYELTEVRIKPSATHPADRLFGTLLQGSNDGINWQTIFYFRQDATSTDYHIFAPQPITDQGYIDAGYGNRSDNSFFWVAKDVSYSMYRITNPGNGLLNAYAEIELYGVPKEATVLDDRGLADRIPSLYYYPGNIVERTAEAVAVDGNLTGTIIGAGWIWNRQIYDSAFDNKNKTSYDCDYYGPECWVGMKFDEPHALTSVSVMPKRGQLGQLWDVQIQGSVDGVHWKTLARYTGDDIPEKQDFVTKEITDPAGYTYVRYICENSGFEGGGAGACKAAEIRFYGAPAAAAEPFTVEPTPIATMDTYEGVIHELGIENVPISGSLVANPIRAGGRLFHRSTAKWEFAFDGDLETSYTKAETNTYGFESWIGYRMNEPTAVTHVGVISQGNQDVIAGVHFQGSADGVHWTTLAQYGFDDVPDETRMVVKPVTDTTAYLYYRVISDGIRGLSLYEFAIYNTAEAPSGAISDLVIDLPETEPTETSAPETVAPETAAPETSAPETIALEIPEGTRVETDIAKPAESETAVPETSAPETEDTAEDAGEGISAVPIIAGIVAAVVIIGIVAGVVVKKKKK